MPLTIKQAARLVGVKPGTVRAWISRNQLVAYRQDALVYVVEAELLECEAARRHAGNRHRLIDGHSCV